MNEYFYETGSTQPPKSRVLIVFLLVLLIFVGGIITALGILNIKLWSAIPPQKEESISLRFSREEISTVNHFGASEPTKEEVNAGLGVDTETVSAFIRAYYSLPQGVYLPRVPDGSLADIAGILPGDILIAVDGQNITDTDNLDALLQHYKPGDTVTLTLYRDGQELSVKLTLTKENG